MKKLTTLFWVIMSLMMIFPVDLSAQFTKTKAGVTKARAGTTLSKQDAQRRTNTQERLMSSMLQQKIIAKRTDFQSIKPFATLPFTSSKSKAPAFAAGDGTLLYGSVIFATNWTEENAPIGAYSFPATGNTTLAPVAIDELISANGGGVYVDGKYHFVNYITFFDMIFATYYVYNTETWEQVVELDTEPTSVGTDWAYDPSTGNVYGCFYNETLDGYLLGTLDLETAAVKKVGDLSQMFFVIAANSKGALYGIGEDGNLYNINKTTGATTLIGATGVSPKYIQSGTFDPKTDKLYWAACLADETAALYEVNVTTGAATLISPFPNDEEVVGLYIPVPAAEDGAPAVARNLNATFIDAATTGKVKFTMPDKTFAGVALNGSLTYSIAFNGEEKVTGTAGAGTEVEKEITVETGMYTIAVTTTNAVGKSPVAKLQKWIGKDAPKAVEDVMLKKGTTENELVLTWKAPTQSIHGGYMDVASLKYKIVRYPGAVIVADKLTATTFSEVLTPTQLANYWYEITAFAGDMEGETLASGKVVLGSAFEVPYLEKFNTENDFNLFTVIDNNEDGETWSYDITAMDAKCTYNSDNAMDDWLITPPVNLGVDNTYKFYFRVRSAGASMPERLKVAMGKSNTVAGMTMELIPATDITNSSFKTMEAVIRVPEAGSYHIGFQSCSDADQFYMHIDSIGIEKGAAMGAPAGVTDLKVVAAGMGELAATISFVTPAKAVDGSALTALTKAEIYRGGELIQTMNAPAVNTSLTYTDNKAKQGNNSYKVIVSNEKGAGVESIMTAFVGVAVPDASHNIVLKEVNGKAVITWEAPTEGVQGGYINPSKLTYSLLRVIGSAEVVVAESISELTFTDDPGITEGQSGVVYYVFAESTGGMGKGYPSNSLVMGVSYVLPFAESFAGGELTNGPWLLSSTGKGKWGLAEEGEYPTVAAQDNDGGLASFVPQTAGDASLLYSGKISLAGSTKPALGFWYYLVKGATDKLAVKISKEGGTFTEVHMIDFATISTAEGWTKIYIPLTDYISAKYIQIGFYAIAGTAKTNLHLDNILIKDMLDHNLVMGSITAPKKVKVGESINITATILNDGLNEATSYTVELYRDNKMVKSLVGETLASGTKKTYTFTETPDLNFGKSASYYVVANYAADLNKDNNKSSEMTVQIVQPTLPVIDDLAGTCVEGKAVLNWSEPDFMEGIVDPVIDDIEKYTSFIINNIGEWTVVDVEGGEGTYGISNGAEGIIKYDNAGAAMAFQVFNPSAAGIAVVDKTTGKPTVWAPNSGDQMLAAFADEDGKNDDWLISPELADKAQTLSFFVKSVTDQYGLETYEVLISSTNKDITSFQNVNNNKVAIEAPLEWTNVTVDLPEGTKYFAIRCTSPDRFALLVDDITYTPASSTPIELSLIGYNVYRDGEKVTSVPVAATTYTDAIPENKEYKYKVTTVYDKGESSYSNEVAINVTGVSIDEILAEGTIVRSVRHAIEIRNAVDKDIYIYAIDGKLVYKGKGEEVTQVPITDGKYVVKAGDKIVKVIVK